MNKILVKFYMYYGRMGSLDGLFITTHEEMNRLYGKEIYFGEVLGKHSEVVAEMDQELFRVIDVGAEAVQKLEEAAGTTISGHNPFDYLEESEEEDEDDDE